MHIKIMLVDDHALFRAGVKSELEMQDDIAIVAEAGSGLDAVRLAKELKPHLVIMDVNMPGLNGIEATRRIKAEVPDTKIIGLSVSSEGHVVKNLLRAGASGFLLKTVSPSSLVKAVREVAEGHGFLSPEVAGDIVAGYWGPTSPAQDPDELNKLTPREREVLQLLAEGKKTREVGELLYISVKTVETHRKQIMDKLQIHSLPELTKWALRNGLTSLD